MKLRNILTKIFPFPLPGLGVPRSGPLPSSWSVRQWNTVLRGGMLGEVSLDALMRSSAAIACSNLIADTIASAPISIVQRDPETGTGQVTQSAASDALLMLTYDDMSSSIFGAAVMGNGFLYFDGSTLTALDSFRTSVYIEPDGSIWVKQAVGPYLPYTQVAHVKFRHQAGFILGFNPALLAQDSLKAALGLIGMAGAMAVNSAHPGIVLQAPEALTDKAIKNIKSSWMEAVGGERQGGVAVTEEGIEVKVLEMPNATDSQMIEAQDWSAGDICRLYAVPPECVGLLRDSNRATSQEAGRALYSRCIRPWAARISDAMSRQLLTVAERKQGLQVAFDLSSLQVGFGKEAADYWAALCNAGIASTNDARDALSLPDVPMGDRVRTPLNMTFLDKLDQVGGANVSRASQDQQQ